MGARRLTRTTLVVRSLRQASAFLVVSSTEGTGPLVAPAALPPTRPAASSFPGVRFASPSTFDGSGGAARVPPGHAVLPTSTQALGSPLAATNASASVLRALAAALEGGGHAGAETEEAEGEEAEAGSRRVQLQWVGGAVNVAPRLHTLLGRASARLRLTEVRRPVLWWPGVNVAASQDPGMPPIIYCGFQQLRALSLGEQEPFRISPPTLIARVAPRVHRATTSLSVLSLLHCAARCRHISDVTLRHLAAGTGGGTRRICTHHISTRTGHIHGGMGHMRRLP